MFHLLQNECLLSVGASLSTAIVLHLLRILCLMLDYDILVCLHHNKLTICKEKGGWN